MPYVFKLLIVTRFIRSTAEYSFLLTRYSERKLSPWRGLQTNRVAEHGVFYYLATRKQASRDCVYHQAISGLVSLFSCNYKTLQFWPFCPLNQSSLHSFLRMPPELTLWSVLSQVLGLENTGDSKNCFGDNLRTN